MCFLFHKWSAYEAPKAVTADGCPDAPTIAQRRVCERCEAVDYRRVLVHN